METRFTVPGKAVPKARPRARCQRMGRKLIALMYTPQTTQDYERHVQAHSSFPEGWPLDADYVVQLDVYHPNNVYGDLDNIAKSVLDGLNKLPDGERAWHDDKQVSGLYLRRGFDPVNPRVEVTIGALPAQKFEKVKTQTKRRASVQ